MSEPINVQNFISRIHTDSDKISLANCLLRMKPSRERSASCRCDGGDGMASRRDFPRQRAAAFATALALAVCAAAPASWAAAPDDALFRKIYRELVELNTTELHGDTLVAAKAMAAHLLAGGFPAADIKVLSSAP